MRNQIATGCLSVISAAVLASSSLGPAQAQEFTLRLTNVDPPYSEVGDLKYPNHVYGMMQAFKNSLEAFSDGRIKVEIYHSGRLGDLRENLESVRAGALEATTPNEGVMSIFYPDIQIVTIPYAFRNAAVAWKVLDGPFGQKLFAGLTEKGFRAVAIGENAGFRIWGNNVRSIKSSADMKGLKIRTMEIPAHQEMVRALGGSPTAVPWLEVYGALQTGVVDGAELPVIGTLQQNLHEQLKYITIDNHVYSLAMIVVSEKWYQKLPTDLQRAVIMAGRVGAVTSRGLSQSLANDVVGQFAKKGIEITYLSSEAQQQLRETVQPAVTKWMEEQLGAKMVAEFKAAVRNAEKEFDLEPSL